MYSDEKIKKTQTHLKERGVKYCVGAYVDIHGAPKAKVVPIEHLKHMAHGSERYTGYALDGLGQAPHDDEISSVPDLDHIIQLPWEPKVAWMPADNMFQGKPYPLNTRVALKNVQAQAASLGYWVGEPYAKQGFMTRAVKALVPAAFDLLRLHRIEAACIPTNIASVKLLEKTGFQREGYARQYLCINGIWQDHLLYAQLRSDPRA